MSGTSRYLWLLDPGHGIDTPGKRSPVWDDGRQLHEWEFNRAICRRILGLCKAAGVAVADIVHDEADIPLSERVGRAHAIADASDTPAVYLSIHANAGGGTGWEVWTSRGETDSDKIATVFARQAQAYYPDMRVRTDYSDGDPDKEAGFYVLRRTRMPALLIEMAFMDTLEPDCRALLSETDRDGFAAMTMNAILEIESEGI